MCIASKEACKILISSIFSSTIPIPIAVAFFQYLYAADLIFFEIFRTLTVIIIALVKLLQLLLQVLLQLSSFITTLLVSKKW